MGLDTSHGCWHGPYSSFMAWREKICEVAGYGDIRDRVGFGGEVPWPGDDPLSILLYHSDCDGIIEASDCAPIADRLESLLPALKTADKANPRIIMNYESKTRQFIEGLREASANNEDVDFH